MYRLLAANVSSAERRRQRSHPAYAKPELLATAPNQVWSWDITKLKGPAKWTCFHLYVILESSAATSWLAIPATIPTVTVRADVSGALTLHATAAPPCAPSRCQFVGDWTWPEPHAPTRRMTILFGVAVQTMKYRPDFPQRFGSIEDARSHCQTFFAWYNAQHCHSGIGHMTPHSVHYGPAGHASSPATLMRPLSHAQAVQGHRPSSNPCPLRPGSTHRKSKGRRLKQHNPAP